MPLGGLLTVGSAAASAALGGEEFFSNLSKEKKATKDLAKLKDPFYKIQDEYLQNNNIAAGLASTGTPDATKIAEDIERRRGLGAGLSAFITSGASPNDVSSLLDVYGKSVNMAGAKDAADRIENIKYFMSTNKDLAGQKNIQFGFNEAAPYERKLQELQKRRDAAEANKYTGLNTAISSISDLGTSLTNASLLKPKTTNAGVASKLFGAADPIAVDNPDPTSLYKDISTPGADGLSPEEIAKLKAYLNRGI